MLNEKQIIKTFLDLVKIDSPSGHEKEVADFILNYCKKINVKAKEDHYGNIIVNVHGEGKPILLSAHIDTVEPGRGIKPEIKNGVIKSVGDTILGADDKAGVVAIMEALKYLKENNIAHRTLEIVLTREEEIGVVGALNLNFKNIKSREGLVIDSSRPLGFITMSSPFIYLVDIEIIGKASHSGAFPEKGIHAIKIASQAISELKLGRIDSETTNNIGVINGGTAMNIIPEKVTLQGEARSLNLKSAKKQVEIFKETFKKYTKKHKAKLKFNARLVCTGYNYKKNDPIIKKIAETNKQTKIKSTYGISCGGSDANVFVENKIKMVDISYGGTNPHTTKETIKTSELIKLTEFVINFIKNK